MLKLDPNLPVFSLAEDLLIACTVDLDFDVETSDILVPDYCCCSWMLGSWTGHFKKGASSMFVLKDCGE